jgi:hypothetical protein
MTKTSCSKSSVNCLQETSAEVVSDSGTNSDKQHTTAKKPICKKSAAIPEYVAKPSDISIKSFKADILGIANSKDLSVGERSTRLKNYMYVSVRDMLRDWCKLYQFVDNPLLTHESDILAAAILDMYKFADNISDLADVKARLSVQAHIKYDTKCKAKSVVLTVATLSGNTPWKRQLFAQPQTFIKAVWNWFIDIQAHMNDKQWIKSYNRLQEDMRIKKLELEQALRFRSTPLEELLK